MYTIHCDISITRRKRYLLVSSPEKQIVFRAKYMHQIIDWMDAEEQSEYLLALESGEIVLRCERLSVQKET